MASTCFSEIMHGSVSVFTPPTSVAIVSRRLVNFELLENSYKVTLVPLALYEMTNMASNNNNDNRMCKDNFKHEH